MNRLILLGNGFDLAHGLKTSYNSFIVWYLIQSYTQAEQSNRYEDELLSIEKMFSAPLSFNGIDSISNLINHYYIKGFNGLITNQSLDIRSRLFQPRYETKIKSAFLKSLLLNCRHANWVDIENAYYQRLSFILTDNIKVKQSNLNSLNHSLKNIISLLSKYLSEIKEFPNIQEFLPILYGKILENDIASMKMPQDRLPAQTQILNFNYTSTIEQYLQPAKQYESPNFIINYIHGKLDDIDNPLIFGFGDELDQNYLKMEDDTERGFLSFIKSFWYFKTSNYHDLIRFLDTGTYQIYIMGHSCGVSDRTMLNMIFEHENCKSIKIYYYEYEGGNNFTTLTQDISKHFKNKGDMRKKIVPFDKSSPMPQLI